MVVALAWTGDEAAKEHQTSIITTISEAVLSTPFLDSSSREREKWQRTKKNFEDSPNIKIYLFQSINSYRFEDRVQ